MDSIYVAALSSIKGFGAAKVRQIVASLGSAEKAWKADRDSFKPEGCIGWRDYDALLAQRSSISVEYIADTLAKEKIAVCDWREDTYPAILKTINNPPAQLFYRGDISCLTANIGIVGSRKASPYGKSAAEGFAAKLAKNKFTVVSGGARGIDTAAHCGALKEGRTAAVLGCGLDVAYPRENEKLFAQIVEAGGVLLSEYLPQTQPLAKNFPARNRIIAGLCSGILVIEAGLRSGSLITAEFALDEGRDVMAVPGSIYAENSRGCHKLIKQGAKLVEDINDILEEYQLKDIKTPCVDNAIKLSKEEQAVYAVLDDTVPVSVDEIIIKTHNRADNIAYLLLQLELKGIVKQLLPFSYVRVFKEASL